MANHKANALVGALGATSSSSTTTQTRPFHGVPAHGSAAPQPRGALRGRFTDEELAAAQQLVLLSESSSSSSSEADVVLQAASAPSSSSSLPSVNNAPIPPPGGATTADAEEEEEGEGVSTGPRVLKQRYRTIRSLYTATGPIDADGARHSAGRGAGDSQRVPLIRGFC